jgi:hypothetical protein
LGGGIDVPRLGFEHREDRPGSGGRRRAQRPRVAYLFANGAPCGSRACTIQTPPGTSMGPLSTLLNLGLVSEHSGGRGHHPCRGLCGLLTRSGGKRGRNLAAQQAPDLTLVNPLCCRPG